MALKLRRRDHTIRFAEQVINLRFARFRPINVAFSDFQPEPTAQTPANIGDYFGFFLDVARSGKFLYCVVISGTYDLLDISADELESLTLKKQKSHKKIDLGIRLLHRETKCLE